MLQFAGVVEGEPSSLWTVHADTGDWWTLWVVGEEIVFAERADSFKDAEVAALEVITSLLAVTSETES